MLTEPITLQVESDAARFYNGAPEPDKEKLQILFGIWLKQYVMVEERKNEPTISLDDYLAWRSKKK